MKTVYKTKYYTVKRNDEHATPRYFIYYNKTNELVHISKTQVEAEAFVRKINKYR